MAQNRALACLATVALAAGLAACGDDDDEAQTLTLKTDGPKITGPATAETGSAEITLDNTGKKPADLTLIRVEGDRSAQEVVKALSGAVRSAPFPEWFFAAGGVGAAQGGQSETVTQVLEPGTYWAFNTAADSPPSPKTAASFEVTGEESDDELPEAETTVTAIDYGFETAGELKAGRNEITFENTGAQPHHLLASPINGDATVEEIERFFRGDGEGEGPPPADFEGGASTAVLEGGDGQNVSLLLSEPGRYVLYCFIADRQGGPPHALKGMVDEVEVE